MLRMLQGDVGSGKTLVALRAMPGSGRGGERRRRCWRRPKSLRAPAFRDLAADARRPAPVNLAILTGRDKEKGPRDRR